MRTAKAVFGQTFSWYKLTEPCWSQWATFCLLRSWSVNAESSCELCKGLRGEKIPLPAPPGLWLHPCGGSCGWNCVLLHLLVPQCLQWSFPVPGPVLYNPCTASKNPVENNDVFLSSCKQGAKAARSSLPCQEQEPVP